MRGRDVASTAEQVVPSLSWHRKADADSRDPGCLGDPDRRPRRWPSTSACAG